MSDQKEKNIDFMKFTYRTPVITYNTDEVAYLLGTRRQTITMYREIGILKAIKTGKRYMFSQAEIERFQRDYEGLDISNRLKALESYKLVKSRS